jgi:hypothetical protein
MSYRRLRVGRVLGDIHLKNNCSDFIVNYSIILGRGRRLELRNVKSRDISCLTNQTKLSV